MSQKDIGNKVPIYKLKTTDEVMKYYDEWGKENKYNKDMVEWNYTGPQETVETFKKSLLGATKTSCMIAFILAGSSFLSLAMGFTGLPRNLAIWIQNMDLSPYVLIFVLMIFYIILGMFLDGISAVVLTMAIIEPMIRQAGFDMIWFGIFLVIVVEMAQITPPVGFNLFVLQGMANRDMGFIARSAFPLFLLMVLAVILVVIFPEIALWMPEQMVKNIN